jgi:hypothetical protein
MAGRQRYTPQQVIAAIEAHRGMLTLAAQSLGCSDETMYNYAKRYPSVASAITRQRQRMLDLYELKLYAAIQGGESWAIQYFLRTIGKSRGYVERQELTGADGQDLSSTVIELCWGDAEPVSALPSTNSTMPHHSNGHDPGNSTRSEPVASVPEPLPEPTHPR